MKRTEHVKSYSIGTTESGKAILCAFRIDDVNRHLEESYLNFSIEELFEAFCLFEYLSSKAIIRHGFNSFEVLLFSSHSEYITRIFLTDKQFDDMKAQYHLETSIDICRFGSKFANVEFTL